MTTNEFKNKIKELGFELILNHDDDIVVRNIDGYYLAKIESEREDTLKFYKTTWRSMSVNTRKELSFILSEYVSTPFKERQETGEDRGEIKKYKLKFKPNGIDIGTPNNNNIYLNYRKELGDYIISNGDNTYYSQTIFTEQEVKDLDDKSNILTVFVKEEI